MNGLLEFLIYMQGPGPYVAAFLVLLLCGIGVPIPEDLTLFSMGMLSYYGLVDLKLSILVCFLGVLIGDSVIFFIGRKYGNRLAKKGAFKRLLNEERMHRARQLFAKWGNKLIFAARFMPGLRAPAYFSAGTLGLPFKVFLFYDGLAALLSVPLLTALPYYFGDQVDSILKIARRVQNGIAFAIIAVVAIVLIKALLPKYLQKRKLAKTQSRKN